VIGNQKFIGFIEGSTPLGVYKKLVEFYKNGELSFKYVKTFNMDEYVGTCGHCMSSAFVFHLSGDS
jgi:6-phosphogluconolactonase/glucosamine-6-phosphate isomerase/deaminase